MRCIFRSFNPGVAHCRYYIQAEKDWWNFAADGEAGLYISEPSIVSALTSSTSLIAYSKPSASGGLTLSPLRRQLHGPQLHRWFGAVHANRSGK